MNLSCNDIILWTPDHSRVRTFFPPVSCLPLQVEQQAPWPAQHSRVLAESVTCMADEGEMPV